MAQRIPKRRRLEVVGDDLRKPEDSRIVVVQQVVGVVQQTTELFTAETPFTMGYISGTFSGVVVLDEIPNMHWALVYVRDGDVLQTLSIGDGDNLYIPSGDVLAHGTVRITFRSDYNWPMKTDIQQDILPGDKVFFITLAQVITGAILNGHIRYYAIRQPFLKK